MVLVSFFFFSLYWLLLLDVKVGLSGSSGYCEAFPHADGITKSPREKRFFTNETCVS